MEKSLDQKLRRILDDPDCGDFILADAKDGDMAYGLAATGQNPGQRGAPEYRSLDQYRQLMRHVLDQGLVDILLMSASTSEQLTIRERLFDRSPVTPAARANDTSEIWLAGQPVDYAGTPSRPFRSATIDQLMCGKADCAPHERTRGVDLGLYSVTFNNDTDADHRTLAAYREFRLEAERRGFRHFLEVFPPNAPQSPIGNTGRFMNDHVARLLAGVPSAGRPLFLKMAYQGPEQMEAIAAYDRRLVPGILGGSAGTTYDAFHQLDEAKRHGARVALYGRKINNAEHQLAFIERLRGVADGRLGPEEAVRSYHGALEKLGIRPHRPIEEDLKRTDAVAGYASNANGRTTVSVDGGRDGPGASTAERIAQYRRRWDRVLGPLSR